MSYTDIVINRQVDLLGIGTAENNNDYFLFPLQYEAINRNTDANGDVRSSLMAESTFIMYVISHSGDYIIHPYVQPYNGIGYWAFRIHKRSDYSLITNTNIDIGIYYHEYLDAEV